LASKNTHLWRRRYGGRYIKGVLTTRTKTMKQDRHRHESLLSFAIFWSCVSLSSARKRALNSSLFLCTRALCLTRLSFDAILCTRALSSLALTDITRDRHSSTGTQQGYLKSEGGGNVGEIRIRNCGSHKPQVQPIPFFCLCLCIHFIIDSNGIRQP
jgi:hypothetical protein